MEESLTPLSDNANSADGFDGVCYNILSKEDLTCEVTNGIEYSDNIAIPATVVYCGETFSVTSIGEYAFYDCDSLTSVTIPNSVTSIGEFAFLYCRGLKSVIVEAGNPNYDSRDNCNALIETATNTLVAGCQNTRIPNSVTSIEESAFAGCDGLTSITIPNSVTNIGGYAFQYCDGLISVTIPDSVTSIGEKAFYKCNSLTSVVSKMKNPCGIDSDCFSDEVYQNATLYVPEGTIERYKSADGWNKFDYIEEGDEPNDHGIAYVFFEVDGINYKILSKKELTCEVAKKVEKYSGDIAIPSTVAYSGKTFSVTGIGKDAFYVCPDLKSVTIPDSVTNIGKHAFVLCRSLVSVTIPDSVTSIGNYAISGCHGLTSITIPSSVTNIGNHAFYGCISLTSVISKMKNPCGIDSDCFSDEVYQNATLYVPKGSIDLYKSADAWNKFTHIEEIDDIDYDFFEVGGIHYKVLSKEDLTCEVMRGKNKYSGDIAIPSTVTYRGNTFSVKNINPLAFFDCRSLKSVTIPNSVTSIGIFAFRGCTNLTSVTIPNSVTSIGRDTFFGCKSLTSVTIPDSVESIGEEAFSHCFSLASVTIPDSVTSIGEWAFDRCRLTSVTIPDSVTSIGQFAFFGCSGLTSITIPNSVTNIGNHAFWHCSGLTSIIVEDGNPYFDSRDNCNAIIETATNTLWIGCQNTRIPNSVTSIEAEAFKGCSGLTSITIPDSVTSIGRWAFDGCEGLTSVISKMEKPCGIDSDCFDKEVYQNATLYVPKGSIDLYKSAENWNKFNSIEEGSGPDAGGV